MKFKQYKSSLTYSWGEEQNTYVVTHFSKGALMKHHILCLLSLLLLLSLAACTNPPGSDDTMDETSSAETTDTEADTTDRVPVTDEYVVLLKDYEISLSDLGKISEGMPIDRVSEILGSEGYCFTSGIYGYYYRLSDYTRIVFSYRFNTEGHYLELRDYEIVPFMELRSIQKGMTWEEALEILNNLSGQAYTVENSPGTSLLFRSNRMGTDNWAASVSLHSGSNTIESIELSWKNGDESVTWPLSVSADGYFSFMRADQ